MRLLWRLVRRTARGCATIAVINVGFTGVVVSVASVIGLISVDTLLLLLRPVLVELLLWRTLYLLARLILRAGPLGPILLMIRPRVLLLVRRVRAAVVRAPRRA